MIEPFWRSTTMHGESLFFVDRGDGLATATLLFANVDAVSITSAAGDVVFEPGRDYTIDTVRGIVSRPLDSRMPFATLDELYPPDDPFVLVGDADEFHRRQASATYTHPANAWHGSVPRSAAQHLPRTIARLSSSRPLTLCLAGDSISEGYNASGFTGAPPYQPAYGDLVVAELERAHRSPVTFRNFATAGWTSDDGAVDIERVAAARPDLMVVAFGINDAGYAEAPAFAANIQAIMDDVRVASPDVEFVLVSPMLPNPRWPYPVMERLPAYRDALAAMCGAGVALADVTSVWTDLLVRKSVHDLTGNGINHPNDFGHRVYAEVILAKLRF